MMDFPVLLAHGALGYWDEVIFIGIVVVFVVMMAVSWYRSRTAEDDAEADLSFEFRDADAPPNSDERFELK